MSAGMMVYLVDEAMVKAVPGSNDTELLSELFAWEGYGESLASIDEDLDMAYRCPGFTHADALRDLFAGRVTRPQDAFAYAYAFGHVCSCLGEWVQDHFHRCSEELLHQLDVLFAFHRVG